MSDLTIVTAPYPPAEWTETVERGLRSYNIAATGITEYYPVGFFIKDSIGEVVAGLLGEIVGGGLHVSDLWVETSLRGRGYAAQMMARAERYALAKSCREAALETGSFQARPFYEKLGYRVYAELKDHPGKSHSRYFLIKSLSSGHPIPARKIDREIIFDPYPSTEIREIVKQGIAEHAIASMGLPEAIRYPANFFLRDRDGEILGGLLGNLARDWIYVAAMWIDKPIRRHGYATRLMAAAEAHAIGKRCTGAFLNTASFQARPLYEKLGYTIFGEMKDHPSGHTIYWMRKRLTAES